MVISFLAQSNEFSARAHRVWRTPDVIWGSVDGAPQLGRLRAWRSTCSASRVPGRAIPTGTTTGLLARAHVVDRPGGPRLTAVEIRSSGLWPGRFQSSRGEPRSPTARCRGGRAPRWFGASSAAVGRPESTMSFGTATPKASQKTSIRLDRSGGPGQRSQRTHSLSSRNGAACSSA
jgi:hypothetical protein